MSYIKNSRFDFLLPMYAQDAAEMIVEHRYQNYDFAYFECDVFSTKQGHYVRFFTNPNEHDDIIDVAKFILEIDNEVVPIKLPTFVFPYMAPLNVTPGGGLMVISLLTKEYTDMDCDYIAEKVTNEQLKFESGFRYVKR